jgi:hypothetical protein
MVSKLLVMFTRIADEAVVPRESEHP